MTCQDAVSPTRLLALLHRGQPVEMPPRTAQPTMEDTSGSAVQESADDEAWKDEKKS